MTALMIEGRAGMPARWMAMTQGEWPAPGPPWRSVGSVAGTVTPIAKVPIT